MEKQSFFWPSFILGGYHQLWFPPTPVNSEHPEEDFEILNDVTLQWHQIVSI